MKNISEIEETIELQNPKRYMNQLWQKVDSDLTYRKYLNSIIKPEVAFFGYVSSTFFNVYYNKRKMGTQFICLKSSGKLMGNKLVVRFRMLDSDLIHLCFVSIIGLSLVLASAYYLHWAISLSILSLFLANFLLARNAYFKNIQNCMSWFESMNFE